MADRIFASNDHSEGYWTQQIPLSLNAAVGNFTSDVTGQKVFTVPTGFTGRISDFFGAVTENGADATDAMSIDFDVLINGVSAMTTKPALSKAAGTGAKTTITAGTGITVGVINTAADNVVAGDQITMTLNITRTTPDTEMAGVSAHAVLTLTADAAPSESI